MKAQPQQTAVDWSRAKGLLADLKSHVRRSLAAQVLIGKELASLKKKLGFTHGGARRGSSRQIGDLKSWSELTSAELGIPDRTADRWIQCFESATARAKARRNKARRENNADELITWELACRLLTIPADELDGKELEQLAECVGRIVDHDSQADLLDELGIAKRPSDLQPGKGGDTRKGDKMTDEVGWLGYSAKAIHDQFNGICEMMQDIRKADYLKSSLHELPLSNPDPEKLTLYKFKGILEDVLHGEVAGLLKFVEEEIASKSQGPPVKARRKSRKARKS